MINTELWVPIPGFSKYEISNQGQVRHVRHRHVLTYTYPYNKYPQVGLSLDGKKTGSVSKSVHKLMVMSFKISCPDGHTIHHKDGDRGNPKLSNLEVLPSKEHWREHRKHPYPSCIVCGKEVRPRSKTCSKECHRKVHYPILSCTFCGKDFERQVTDINRTLKNPRYIHKDHHFCSRSCFAKNSWKEGLWRKPQTL